MEEVDHRRGMELKIFLALMGICFARIPFFGDIQYCIYSIVGT